MNLNRPLIAVLLGLAAFWITVTIVIVALVTAPAPRPAQDSRPAAPSRQDNDGGIPAVARLPELAEAPNGSSRVMPYPAGASLVPALPTTGLAGSRPAVPPVGLIPVAAAPSLVSATAPTVADARRYAIRKLGAAQFACLDELWQRESRWRVDATNRTSGAYGIPQALPGSKMASAGADWRTNPVTQVRWGIAYIHGRYGSACSALRHALYAGWY